MPVSVRLSCALAALAVLAAAGCVPPEEDPTIVRSFDEDTIMGELQARGSIVVGIEPDFPPFSTMTDDGSAEGFLVGVAEIVADELGIEAEFVAMDGDEMLPAVEGGTADLVFPPVPITESLARIHTVANPYYVAHQRFLQPAGFTSGVPNEVCSFTFPETGVLPTFPGEGLPRGLVDPPEMDVLEVGDPSDCDVPLIRGDVPAMTAPDLFLIATLARLEDRNCRARGPCGDALEITGDDLTTEGYGPAVALGANGFADFVGAALGEAKDDGRYMDLYTEWIAPYLEDPIDEPFRMSVEEAAALYPTGR